jgi:hypothetical protein
VAIAFLLVDAARSNDAVMAIVFGRLVCERAFDLGVAAAREATDDGSCSRSRVDRMLFGDDPAVDTLWRRDRDELAAINLQVRSYRGSVVQGFVSFCTSIDLDPTLVLSSSPPCCRGLGALRRPHRRLPRTDRLRR